MQYGSLKGHGMILNIFPNKEVLLCCVLFMFMFVMYVYVCVHTQVHVQRPREYLGHPALLLSALFP